MYYVAVFSTASYGNVLKIWFVFVLILHLNLKNPSDKDVNRIKSIIIIT